MYWEEWVNWIKNHYKLKPEHFRTYWMQWDSIRENMQKGFLEHKVKETRIEILPLKECHYLTVFQYLFNQNQNYWLQLGKELYDCNLEAIDILLMYSHRTNYTVSEFAIIDKKYRWAAYFTRNSTFNITKLIICGPPLRSIGSQLKHEFEK